MNDPLVGKTVHGDLLIKAKLGEGGMGTVYFGVNRYVHDMRHAVKVIRREITSNASFQRRFFDEATLQSKLDHANIVQVQNFFKEGVDYFLVMAYVDGEPLSDMIDRTGGPIVRKQALSIMKEILLALNCAHENGILHRDVKPSNVLVDKSGRARLTDFGIARGVTVGGVADAVPVGTAEYMSPEQIMTPARIDHRADVYSAGVMFFEMLTGRLPFTGESEDAIKLRHIEALAPNPRDVNRGVSRGLAAIVVKSLEKDPDRRFQGCLEFAKAIEAYEQRYRHYLLTGAGTAVALSLGVAYLVWIRPPIVDHTKAARTLVDSTVSNYSALCNQAVRWQQKQRVRPLVILRQDAAMIEDLNQEIRGINEAMARLTGDIASNLSELAKLKSDAVETALQQPSAEAERRHYLRLTAGSLNTLRSGGGSPTREMLERSCGQ